MPTHKSTVFLGLIVLSAKIGDSKIENQFDEGSSDSVLIRTSENSVWYSDLVCFLVFVHI